MLVVNQKRIGNAGVVAFVSTSINLAAFDLARQLNVNFCISFATPSRISSPFLSIGKIQDKKKTAKDKITQQKKEKQGNVRRRKKLFNHSRTSTKGTVHTEKQTCRNQKKKGTTFSGRSSFFFVFYFVDQFLIHSLSVHTCIHRLSLSPFV